MRALRLLAALLVLCWAGPWPLAATPTPTFAVSSPSANAGAPEVFTITRVSGGSGAYVLFQTHDGTAHAGIDYTATSQLVYIKAGVSSATVSVATAVNPNATGNLTFTVAIASTKTPAVGTATIIEPAPPPPPPPVQCPDGSTVPAGQTCPPPPAPSNWTTAALAEGGYAQVTVAGSGVPRGDIDEGFDASDVYRSSVAGEYVKLSAPSFAFARDGTKTCLVRALSDRAALELRCADLAGAAPASGYMPPL